MLFVPVEVNQKKLLLCGRVDNQQVFGVRTSDGNRTKLGDGLGFGMDLKHRFGIGESDDGNFRTSAMGNGWSRNPRTVYWLLLLTHWQKARRIVLVLAF